MTDEGLRSEEAAWLRDRMNQVGVGNTELRERLREHGWTGQLNNISLWRSGAIQVPDRVVPWLAEALSEDASTGDWHEHVVAIFARRQPYLAPYLSAPGKRKAGALAVLPTPSAPSSYRRPVYIPKSGELRGVRHVPYKDAEGNYIAGRSRYKEDKKSFRTLPDLLHALARDPKLHVRVIAEEMPGAKPSLVRQESLVWE